MRVVVIGSPPAWLACGDCKGAECRDHALRIVSPSLKGNCQDLRITCHACLSLVS